MKDNHKSKNGTKPTEDSAAKKIPIIETLKPKKRYTKLEKELIEAGQAVMDAITRQQNAKV